MHDPRGKAGLALSYAASPTGADHVRAPHDTPFQAPGPNLERIAAQLVSEKIVRLDRAQELLSEWKGQ